MQSRNDFEFYPNFDFGTQSLFSSQNQVGGTPFPPAPGNFLLLDSTFFLLLDLTNLLLL